MDYSEILYMWLHDKQNEIRMSSYKNYERSVRNWIIPTLGDREVSSIGRKDLQNFIISFSQNHKHNTVIKLTKPISGSMIWAKENGYIIENPWYKIKIPNNFDEKEIPVFTPKEIKKLIAATGYSQIKKDMIIIGYRTGMRIGEILTLKWNDVNFSEKFVMVNRTLSDYNNGRPEITIPKTRKSRRRIDIDSQTLKMLERRYQENNRFEYVFCKEDGTIYSRQGIHISKMCRNVGIKPRSFHALRHTHATLLLASGVHPKIVQERLGHAKISTTLDTYSHLIPGMQQVAVDVFNKIV